MKAKLRTVAECRVPVATQWARAVARECSDLCSALGATGWDFVEIAEAIGTTRKTLYAWRVGDTDMPAAKMLALRALASEHARKVGT